MTPTLRCAGFGLVLLLAATGSALAQSAAATGAGAGGSATTSPAPAASGSALPSGGVPAAGTVGGMGTPPADVQGKPGMSTPGANKP